MIRIYCDSNDRDEDERFILDLEPSLKEIEDAGSAIRTGERVLLYMPGEFEVQGTLVFAGIWKAVPEWDTLKYSNDG